MKVLFISRSGSSLGLAERVKNEGHIASFAVVDRHAKSVGEGIVDKLQINMGSDINELLKGVSPDLVVFDATGMGKTADYIRTTTPTLGACRWADHATLDYEYSHKLMKQVGIQYTSYHEAEGVEVECEMWWDGLHSTTHNITFVDKRFMNGNVGPYVGGAGSVVRMIPAESKLVVEGVGKMERLLKKTNYRGPISLNMVVNDKGLFGVSLSVMFNYHSLQALFEIYKGSVTQFLHTISIGGKGDGQFTRDYAIAVKLSLPPYPYTKRDVRKGVPIEGVNNENSKHLWWRDIRRMGGGYESAGTSGHILT
ncbi:hypothetical protein LCGC14_2937170, partial [marine sediment metagenome]